MKFNVSEKYLRKRRRGPFVSAALIALIGGLLCFASGASLVAGVSIVALLVVFCSGLNWLGARRFLNNAKDHHLEIIGENLVSRDSAYKTEIDLRKVDKLVLNKRRSRVDSIILKGSELQGTRLEHYENMDFLAELIERVVGQDKVRVQRWLHS